MALLGVAYAFTAHLSQLAFFQRSYIGLFWAPNALVLSALLLTSRRWWVAVLPVAASAQVVAMTAANPTWRMIWQLAANDAAVVVTAELLRRYIGLPLRNGGSLERPRSEVLQEMSGWISPDWHLFGSTGRGR